MDCHKFEEIISQHCAPVLMGKKPANLVSFSKEKMPELPNIMKIYEEKLSDEDIYMEVLCGCRKHYLVLVYRKEVLEEYLKQPEVVELLVQDGYSKKGELKEKFSYLRKRFEEKKEFPHEIGLFLGYPLEDVKGFRINSGAGCKFCGYWKVYGDVEKAKLQFEVYDRCRAFVCGQIKQGYSILQILADHGNRNILQLQSGGTK